MATERCFASTGPKIGQDHLNLDSPETWRWIWFVMALIFIACELSTAATFFFLPFAIGAAISGVLAVFGVGLDFTAPIFLALSVVAFAGFWKLGRKFDQADEEQEGVGATRWIGQEARVVQPIEPDRLGTVRLEREEWRAESADGSAIAKDTVVLVTAISGTRLVVSADASAKAEVTPTSETTTAGTEGPTSAQGAK